MAIVRQYSKRSNTTYVYEASYRWDPELKQSRSVRKLIGKIDEATGEIIPTSGKPGRPKKSIADPDTHTPAAPSEPRETVASLKRELWEKDKKISSLEKQVLLLQQRYDEQKALTIKQLKMLIEKLEG